MRIENWKEFKHDCDLLGYDVFTAETEAQLQYNENATGWALTLSTI